MYCIVKQKDVEYIAPLAASTLFSINSFTIMVPSQKTRNWGERKDEFGCDVDVDRLNEYFAGVATDQNYNRNNVTQVRKAVRVPLQF